MVAIAVTLTVAVLAMAIFVGALFLHRKPPPDYWLRLTATGKPLKWDRDAFPLIVLLDPGLPAIYQEAYRQASQRINWCVGATLFGEGILAPKGTTQALENLLDGNVYISLAAAAPNPEPDHGMTSSTIDRETGEIKKALIQLPPGRHAVALSMIMHDLFHVLGFRDDSSSLTIMHPKISRRPQKTLITTEDQRRLRKTFDTSFSKV